MLFFYALLFFLFCNTVVSTPFRSNTPGPGQGRHSQGRGIQRSATSLGHRPASQPRPEDGYWVLKRPQASGIYLNRGYQVSHSCHSKAIDTLNRFYASMMEFILFSR